MVKVGVFVSSIYIWDHEHFLWDIEEEVRILFSADLGH
jgi:hypothetical protein